MSTLEWFGEKAERVFENPSEEERIIDDYLLQFKNGNFQNKREFIDSFLHCNDPEAFLMGIRIFVAVCTHKDFDALTDFFALCDEKPLLTFLAYVKETLSLQVIPYLLAVLETWLETDVGIEIHRNLLEMLGQFSDEEYADVEECGQAFLGFSSTNDLQKYYYRGEPVNYGNLTKSLIMIAMSCKSKNRPFYASVICDVLSNSFGIQCPIASGEMVTDDKAKDLFAFVERIAQMKPEQGAKYFYGHRMG